MSRAGKLRDVLDPAHATPTPDQVDVLVGQTGGYASVRSIVVVE